MTQPQRRFPPLSQHPSSTGRRAASLPASPHHVGTWGGTHPEDQPYTTAPYAQQQQPQGWNRLPVQADEEDDMEQDEDRDDDLYSRRTPRSAIRYRSTMTA